MHTRGANSSPSLRLIAVTFAVVWTMSAAPLAQAGSGAPNKEPTDQRSILSKLREKLHDRWNHLLNRSQEPVALSSTQQEVIGEMSRSPATVHVSLMRVPDAATVEYLLTRPAQQDDRFAKIALPVADGRLVTLLRALPSVKTDSGFTWRGKVEDTDEPAVLMLWRDGHLSGYFAHRGSIFTVNGVGGDVHVVAEIDRNQLPPDHAPGTKSTSAAHTATGRKPDDLDAVALSRSASQYGDAGLSRVGTCAA